MSGTRDKFYKSGTVPEIPGQLEPMYVVAACKCTPNSPEYVIPKIPNTVPKMSTFTVYTICSGSPGQECCYDDMGNLIVGSPSGRIC